MECCENCKWLETCEDVGDNLNCVCGQYEPNNGG
jgi:hypothetical protein